jgi:pectate lyase
MAEHDAVLGHAWATHRGTHAHGTHVRDSWNRVFNHDKSMLLGHSDDNASQDVGHLRVTYHHNWFDGSGTRHPRVRFGNPVHVFNNFYTGNEYGVASTMNAGVLVEGNYFEDVEDPTLVGFADSGPGRWSSATTSSPARAPRRCRAAWRASPTATAWTRPARSKAS